MNHKFKAYDTKEKIWLFAIECPNMGCFSLTREAVLSGALNLVDTDKLDSDIVFMQYINITNDYADELCVGDVLMDERLNGNSRFYKIFEREGGFVFNTHQDDFKKPIDKIIFTEACADGQSVGFLKQCKVIGNYIVNPELYTDKNL